MAAKPLEARCITWTPGVIGVGTSGGVVLFTKGGVQTMKAAGLRLVRSIAIADDGTTVLAGVEGKNAYVMGSSGGAVVKLVGKKIGAAGLVSITPDGTRAIHARVAFDASGAAQTKNVFQWLSAFTAGGTVVVSCGDHQELTFRRHGRDGAVLEEHTLPAEVKCFAAAVDADACVAGLADGSVAIFRGAGAPEIVKLFDDYEVNSVAISRNGFKVAAAAYVVATGGGGPKTKVYVLAQNRSAPITIDVPFAMPTNGNGLAFSPGAKRLAVVASDSSVQVAEDDGTIYELALEGTHDPAALIAALGPRGT
jgi:hypothetical protein